MGEDIKEILIKDREAGSERQRQLVSYEVPEKRGGDNQRWDRQVEKEEHRIGKVIFGKKQMGSGNRGIGEESCRIRVIKIRAEAGKRENGRDIADGETGA